MRSSYLLFQTVYAKWLTCRLFDVGTRVQKMLLDSSTLCPNNIKNCNALNQKPKKQFFYKLKRRACLSFRF